MQSLEEELLHRKQGIVLVVELGSVMFSVKVLQLKKKKL